MANSSINWSANASALLKQIRGGVLGPDLCDRDTRDVGWDLVGKVLVVREPGRDGEILAARIVDTKAYRAGDPDSRAPQSAEARLYRRAG